MASEENNNRDDLAAEYVLGTLQGNARLQFENLMREDADMRRRVHDWEARLFPLSDGLTPTKPHKRVWKKIQQRINPKTAPTTGRLNWWRAWGMAASVMLLVVSVYMVQLEQPLDSLPTTVAVLSDNTSQQAAWVVQTDYNKNVMVAQALKVSDPGENKAYELWMLPANEPPKSLGLLPLEGARSVNLTEQHLAVLKRTGAFAVSLEPSGGSPTGLPTGPVLYQGKILTI